MNLQYCLVLAFCVLVSYSSAFKEGQKYLYNYHVNTLQSLSSRKGASTWSRLNIEVSPLTSTTSSLSLKFKISSITNALGSVAEPTETSDPNYGLTSEFMATYGNGIEFKVNANDGRSTVGLKKSIASLFFVQKSTLSSFSKFEESPVGHCNTIYSLNGLNVTKTRDYGNCTEDVDMMGKKFMSPEFHKCTRNPEHSIPWVSRMATYTYSMDNGLIKSLESLETVSFTLFGHKSSSCIEITGSLKLESSSPASSEPPKGLVSMPLSGKSPLKNKLDFDSAVVNLSEPSKYAMWPKTEVADIIKNIETLANSINEGMSSPALSNDNFTMDFIELQLSLSRLSLSELQSLYTTIKGRTDSVPRIFLDAMRFTSSNPAFSFMKTFIKSTDEKEKMALRGYLQLIPFRELKVSKPLLEGYLELCKQSLGSGLESTCFLSFANILQIHCTDSRSKSPDACNAKISTFYYNKMITTIREIIPAHTDRDLLENRLANNILNEESLRLLLERISDPRLQVRRTATVALFGHRLDAKSTPISNIQNLLYGKVMNRTEDHAVRIYALLVYMKTGPSLSQFKALTRYLADPMEDEQVAHYTFSLLGAMKHTVNPCYAGFALLSKYGRREMKSLKGRFSHTAMALSTARIYESYDKDFGFGGSTVFSYIMNKKSLSASVYLEEKMVVNGFTGGHLALLIESLPGSFGNGSSMAETQGLDTLAAAIVTNMTNILNGTPRSSRPTSNDIRFSAMINGRIVDTVNFFQLARIFQGATSLTSLNRLIIGQQVYNYIQSEHGFTLFNLMVSGGGLFARAGTINIENKPTGDVLFQAALSPTVRRDVGAYTLTGVKSPFGSGRAGIMTSIKRTNRLPLNVSYIITKKTAHLKFKMPTEPVDFMWYRMNAYTFNEKSSIGSIRSSLKPFFVDSNGKTENDLTQVKTIWKGFLGNGLKMTTTMNRLKPMDDLGYRYRLLEKSLYNDDIRLMRMKFEYGAQIVPIDWKLSLIPDPKVSEVTFAFNRSINLADDSRTGEYQMSVMKNSETIISTRVSYSYTTDFLNHYLRLYYNNYLKNIHTCIKGDIFAPKVNFARYTSVDMTSNPEDKLHFNGSIYFDQSCSKKDIIIKGEFSPSEDQKDPRNIQLYSQYCGKYGLLPDKIPYCAGYHYHMGELRSVKIHVTHKDVPSYFWRYLTYIHNKGIQKYANQVSYYGSNEVTDPSVTLITANSTWFSPYKYNVSYKMVDREEVWTNIPSTGLAWPNSYSLFDFHVYQAFHRTLRIPSCYVQKSRVRTFDESPANMTVKPGCLKTLIMNCYKNEFVVLFSQTSDGKLKTIEVYHLSPAAKLEIDVPANTMLLNGSPYDLTAKSTSKAIAVKDFGIYKRISLVMENIKIYYDDVGIYVSAMKGYHSQVCGLCGNMNSCRHDDLHPPSSTHHHNHASEYLWLTKDDRNTAMGCVQP